MNDKPVCRTCLTETDESIFQVIVYGDIEIPLIVMLSECMGIEVSEDDEIPLKICDDCAEQTITYYTFRRKCLASEKKLKRLHSKLGNPLVDRISVTPEINIETVNMAFSENVTESIELDMEIQEIEQFDENSTASTSDPLGTDLVKETENIELPHECPICLRRFKRHYNMKRHMQVHDPPESRKRDVDISYLFICEFCDHEFLSKDHLKEHLLTHAGEKPITSKSQSQENITKNKIKKDLPHECPKCNKCFKRRYNLKKHMYTHEPKENRIHIKRKAYVYTCDYCGHTFGYKNHLRQHLRKHTGEKPYKCELCDYSSAYFDGLKQHKASHSDARPFKCKFCDKWFKTATSRCIHQANHSLAPFECVACSKIFKTRDSLRRHKINIHSAGKPSVCKYCYKKFTRPQYLEEHIQHVHENENKINAQHTE